MQPSVLYTIIGLLVAVYAIIPTERKIDLKVRFNWIDLFIITIAFLLVHYILFYPILSSFGFVLPLGEWKLGFNPNNASYIIILSTTFFLIIRYVKAPLRKQKINLFQKLNESLLQEEKYSELLFVLENNYKRLFKIYYGDFFLPNLKRKLTMEPVLRIDFSEFGLSNFNLEDLKKMVVSHGLKTKF